MGIAVFLGFLFMSDRRTMIVVAAFVFLFYTFVGFSGLEITARELGIRSPTVASHALMSAINLVLIVLVARAVRWSYFRFAKGESTSFI
jgi:hypothetical protein